MDRQPLSDPDRLTSAPMQARTCPNCACPMIGSRCVPCGWVDAEWPIVVDDDDDDTDLYTPDTGGSD